MSKAGSLDELRERLHGEEAQVRGAGCEVAVPSKQGNADVFEESVIGDGDEQFSVRFENAEEFVGGKGRVCNAGQRVRAPDGIEGICFGGERLAEVLNEKADVRVGFAVGGAGWALLTSTISNCGGGGGRRIFRRRRRAG